MKKNKKSKKQGRKQKQSNDSCQSLDCLNNLVLSLKLEKDTVRNFLAQEKKSKSQNKPPKKQTGKERRQMGHCNVLGEKIGRDKGPHIFR